MIKKIGFIIIIFSASILIIVGLLLSNNKNTSKNKNTSIKYKDGEYTCIYTDKNTDYTKDITITILINSNEVKSYNRKSITKFSDINTYNKFSLEPEYTKGIKDDTNYTITTDNNLKKEQITSKAEFYLDELKDSNYKCTYSK